VWTEFFHVTPGASGFNVGFIAQAVFGVITALVVTGAVIFWSRSLVWVVVASLNAIALLIGQFSIWYLAHGGPADWNVPLTRLDSLMVALGTFTTAGSGGITPQSEFARGLVTTQMGVDVLAAVVLFGLLVARLAARLRSR
jgi:hypothetical protein